MYLFVFGQGHVRRCLPNSTMHLSDEIRWKIIHWRLNLEKSAIDIAELAGCSVRTVWEVLRIHRMYADIHSPYARRRGRERMLDTNAKNFIAALVEANPAIYLDEIQSRLESVHGISPSIATISRTMHQLDLNNKRISPESAERDEMLRATWQAAMVTFRWIISCGSMSQV